MGDVVKTLFYIWLSAPSQFAFSGTIQTVTDVYIMYQIWRYKQDLALAASNPRPTSEGSSGTLIIHDNESGSGSGSRNGELV